MNLLGFIMSLVHMQAVHGWLSAYERLVNSQKFFSPYLTQEDLSRLGRNTIDTGYYIEQYFRIRSIRFIAVNENFDTAAPEDAHSGIIIPLRNMIKNISHSGKVSNDFSLFRRFCCINRCFRCSCGKFSIVHGE